MSTTGGPGFCRTQTIALEEVDRPWVVDIEKEVETKDSERCGEEEKLRWMKPCIYRIPAFAKNLNKKAFTPQVVSLGPFYHGAEHLMPLESHKRRALIHFLRRSRRPLIDFVRAMERHLETLQDSYEPLGQEWRDDPEAFLRLMIVDGCFMHEVLRLDPAGYNSPPKVAKAAVANAEEKDDYDSNDPFYGRHGMLLKMPYIRRDMLMLENQLPLLVLKVLLEVAAAAPTTTNTNNNDDDNSAQLFKPMKSDRDINHLVLRWFISDAKAHAHAEGRLGLHVLGLFRQVMITQQKQEGSRSRSETPFTPPPDSSSVVIVRSAVSLREAGVHFKLSKSSSLKDITFDSKTGVLSLPPVVVDDAIECTFLNMVALEHQHPSTGNEVTSYIAFMDEIIDSGSDVQLLHRKGIVQNAMGSDKVVAELFNTMASEVILDPYSDLALIRHNLNLYCKNYWTKWWADLIHTYFRSPWAGISVVAAIFVILLTITQTVFGIIKN